AMEMIAAFRFKRAENRFQKTRAYLRDMEQIVGNLSASKPSLPNPLFDERKVASKALVFLSADKGLCGSYNVNLMRVALRWLDENKAFRPILVPVGKVAAVFFRKRGIETAAVYPDKTHADFALAQKLTGFLKDGYLAGRLDQVEVLYTPYRSGSMGSPALVPFLSLSHLASAASKADAKAKQIDYICEPDFASVLSALLERYLSGKMYLLLLESLTSELNARRIAMSQATDNGQEVLDRLTLLRNKTRQAAITNELSEIVSGAAGVI
ncbi:MAG: ATP synthase F1 subunit gamma, partial [Candidatus Omnitrophota bacterium]